MSQGMKKTWVKGERVASPTLKGKNKGPVIEQDVTLVWVPKAQA